MEQKPTREQIKKMLPEYLSLQGINTSKPFSCLNPDHEDKNPSMSYNKNLHNVKCFSCNATYDIFDLVGLQYGLTNFTDKSNKAIEVLKDKKIDIESIAQKRAIAQNNEDKFVEDIKNKAQEKYIQSKIGYITQTNYMQERGISLQVCHKYNIGYDYNCTEQGLQGVPAIIIPTSKNTAVIRNINPKDDKERYRKIGSVEIFNKDIINKTDKPIFVAEGEIDALSIIELGYEAIALGGVGSQNKFIDILNATNPKNSFILVLDNDEAGKKAAKEIKEKINDLIIPTEKYPSGTKDINKFLLQDKKGLKQYLENAILEINPYIKNNAKHNLRAFINGIAESVNTPYIPTGFDELDKILDGGLYEGLYTIGAISSLGKTTFTLQIADQIAERGNDVLIFSLEMSRFELMAKSISRETMKENFINEKYTYSHAKSTRGITTGSRYKDYNELENELIDLSIENYEKYAENIYISEGMGDIGTEEIKETIKQHIIFTGNKPVAIIDYLQLLVAENERSTDKQNMDKSIMELKRISRDYKIPVIAISSLNRASYTSNISMEAFKESGAIEYSSDVLIGLQLKINYDGEETNEKAKVKLKKAIEEAKSKNPREIELKILKNRNGKTGDKLYYEYFPIFNFFKEVENNNGRFITTRQNKKK